jgi:cyclic beta-1,2-glucan synthetase
VASPLLVAWLIAPQIADVLSRPVNHSTTPLTETQRRQVRRLARRTWAFFEQFAGPNDHWLPPDHFQESPRGSVEHYTTPTNIGLFLVSTLSAYDLGYMSLPELAVRLRSTLETMDELEHYRGHLLNWYDSEMLTALPPRYISTVDSGNLAACLITLKQGCLALVNAPVLNNKQWQGLLAIMDILAEALEALEKNNPHSALESFEVELTGIYERVSAIQDLPEAWVKTLAWLSGEGWERVSRRLLELLESHPNLDPESLTDLQLYLDLMHHSLQDMQRSLDLFAPWLGMLESAPTELTDRPGWQELRNSLPAALPTLGQVEAVYGHIKTALNAFKARLQAVVVPVQEQNEAALAWCQKLDESLSSARIKSHVSAILTKLGVSSRTEAATLALRSRLVD